MATDAVSLETPSRSDPLVRATPFFYGWVMLGVAMIAQYATSPAQTYGVAIFNKHIATSLATERLAQSPSGGDVALTREMIDAEIITVTSAYLWGTVLAAIPVPWVGALADRWGLRKTMTLVIMLFGLACLFMSQVQGPFMLFIGFLAIRTLGQGSLSLLAGNTTDMWFHRRLGFANGIRNLSAPIAFATFPLIVIALINQFGWQHAYAVLGLAVWAVMLPILLFVFRNRPEDIGQLPDGRFHRSATATQSSSDADLLLPQLTLAEAMGTRALWITTSMMTMWGMIGTALMFMVIPYIESRGMVEADAQVVFIGMAASMAVCQFIGGIMADYVKLNYLLAAGACGLGLGVLVYLWIDSVWMAGCYAVVFGIGQGLCAAGSNSLFARYYGRAHLGKIKGFLMMSIVAGTAAGPFLLSGGKQLLGSYNAMLLVFAAMLGIQSIACLFATPPKSREAAALPHPHPNRLEPTDGTLASEGSSAGDQPQLDLQTAR